MRTDDSNRIHLIAKTIIVVVAWPVSGLALWPEFRIGHTNSRVLQLPLTSVMVRPKRALTGEMVGVVAASTGTEMGFTVIVMVQTRQVSFANTLLLGGIDVRHR